VCDLDGDGVLTSADLFPFYREQMARMAALGQEAIRFDDVLCQFADLLRPARPGHFCVGDFLNPERVKLTGCFFNSLFDLHKFNRFEAREAKLVKQGDNYDAQHSQWNAYAAEEYTRLAAEDSGANSNNGGGGYQSYVRGRPWRAQNGPLSSLTLHPNPRALSCDVLSLPLARCSIESRGRRNGLVREIGRGGPRGVFSLLRPLV
jgi:hypothetical protein